MISYLPATPGEVTEAIAAFEALNPTLFRQRGSLNEMVAEGWCEPITIQLEGIPHLVLFVSVSPDNGLWIHVAQAIQNSVLNLLFAAVDRIKEDRGLKYSRFTTCRRGLVEAALADGYTVDGVLMTKG